MARKKELLSDQELNVFYHNYLYMWEELLLISPYEAKKREIDSGERVLPAFCTLSRMYADAKEIQQNPQYRPKEKDIPTMYQVKKVVDYYNRNLIPSIVPGEFIHTDLKSGYDPRFAGKSVSSSFDGLYYGFYFVDQEEVHGAVLKIKKEHDEVRVTMISGFDFSRRAEIEQAKKIECYTEYYRFAKKYTHFYYYEGKAAVGKKTLYINLAGRDESQRIITLMFNVERYLDRYRRFPEEYYYRGGLGFAMATSLSDTLSSPRFYQFGMIAGDKEGVVNQQGLKAMIDSVELKELLKLKTSQKHSMTMESDKMWFRFVKEKRV